MLQLQFSKAMDQGRNANRFEPSSNVHPFHLLRNVHMFQLLKLWFWTLNWNFVVHTQWLCCLQFAFLKGFWNLKILITLLCVLFSPKVHENRKVQQHAKFVFCWNFSCHLPKNLCDNPWAFLKSDKLALHVLLWNCYLLCWNYYTCVMGVKFWIYVVWKSP